MRTMRTLFILVLHNSIVGTGSTAGRGGVLLPA